MIEGDEHFRRGAVQPIACLREGWRLVADKYWLYVGISFLAVLIGYGAPMYILLGPMMCGVYLCLLASQRGERPSLELLFKGFDHFVNSLIAAMLKFVPLMLSFFVAYLMFLFLMIATQGGRRPRPQAGFFLSLIAFLWLSWLACWLVIDVLFSFAYPLIVDRRLTGARAVVVSFKAAFANFGGLLLLIAIETAMCLVGALFCYVGLFLVLPISFASSLIAYRQVFPAADEWDDFDAEDDAEPPRRSGDASRPTDIEVPPRR